MSIEVIEVSDSEQDGQSAVTISDTTSSDDGATPQVSQPVHQATFTPAVRFLGARKSAPGGQGARLRAATKKHTFTAQATPRAATSRQIVRADDDETSALAAQFRSANPFASASDDPFLLEIPYPFTLSIQLKDIVFPRLYNSGAPIAVHLAVAFRHVEQSTANASVSATAAFPLPPPQVPSASSSTGPLRNTPERLPKPVVLRVLRNPVVPLKPRDPYSTAIVPRVPKPESLAEIVLRITVGDPAAPLHVGAVSLTREGRLIVSGKGASKRSADGAQVNVSWNVDFPRSTRTGGDLSDEELNEVIEREMHKCEEKWRLEAAERILCAIELEAQRPPVYGPPDNLALDATVPQPSAFQERPISADSEPHSFSPIPRYLHTDFAARAVPLAGNLLESFPATSNWEDSPSEIAKVEKQVHEVLYPGPVVPLGGPDERTDDEKKRDEEEEVQWRFNHLIDYGSFDAPDVGRTTRDFAVLKSVFKHLNIDLEQLAKLEEEATAQEVADNVRNDAYFSFERSLPRDHVLLRAFRIFEGRTGRSPFQVQREHRHIDDEQILPKRDEADICWLCGAYLCTVHPATLSGYNVPTKPPFDPSPADGCRDCGYDKCFAHDGMTTDEPDERIERLLAEGMPKLDSCTASLILGRPVEKDARFTSSPRPRRKANPDPSKWYKKHALLPTKSDSYKPCACEDACTDDCLCVESRTYCDRWCRCPPSCTRRYGGCKDRDCTDDCYCRDRGRDCDPQLCGCTADTCHNSSIRLGRFKATTAAPSRVPGAGYGAFLLEPVKRHELVGLYGGEQFPQELGDNPTMESRWGFWRSAFVQLEKQSYWFDVDEGTAADSTLLGNVGRFINAGHQNSDGTTVGPRPNLASKIVHVAGTHQVGIYALRDLEAGDELIMDYGPLYTTLPLPTKP